MEASFLQRNNLTPGKFGLIVGLVVVLVAIVAYQIHSGTYGSSPQSPPESTTSAADEFVARRRGEIPATTVTAKSTKDSAKQTDLVTQWPSIPLEETLAHNPFFTPPLLRSAVVAKPEELVPFAAANTGQGEESFDPDTPAEHRRRVQELRELIEAGASMVLTTKDGASVAVVNGRTIRIGDTIHGMRVTEITAEGVVLESTTTDQ